MGVYFWIAIPVDVFFQHCSETMKKHGVSAYVEMINATLGKRNYMKYSEENASHFLDCFSSPDYHSFFFSSYPFSENLGSTEFGLFFDSPVADHSIIGSGGYETDKTLETIHLRQIMKQPDKSIKAFYAALQRNLKKIPDLKESVISAQKKQYYLSTSKTIIPQNARSRLIKVPWEEHCLHLGISIKQE